MYCISAADDNFADHLSALIHSAWLHMPDCRFYLLDHGICAKNMGKLRDFAAELNFHLEILPYDIERLSGLPVSRHISPAAYARLLIPELVPDSIDRIVYIDADTIVTDALAPLMQLDLEGHPIAACHDAFTQDGPRIRELGVQPGCYFNSGVMVLDLRTWREHDIGSSAMQAARTRPELMAFWDQCALNGVLAGRVKFLDRAWNFQTHFLFDYTPDTKPKVVHYTGLIKPWGAISAHPLRELYWFHRRQTPWANDWRPYISRSMARSFAWHLKTWMPRKRSIQRRQRRAAMLKHFITPYIRRYENHTMRGIERDESDSAERRRRAA